MRVLLTAIGCPGGVPTIRALKAQGAEVIGTDMDRDALAGRFVDEFYEVPPGRETEAFIDTLASIAAAETPDVLLPQSSHEVLSLATHRDRFDAPVLVSEPQAIETCLDKWEMYSLAAEAGVPIPEVALCHDEDGLLDAVAGHDYNAVIKPLHGKGARGVRIVEAGADRVALPWREWPSPIVATATDLIAALERGSIEFPVMVMERLRGPVEHAVDVYCDRGRILAGFVRQKIQIVHGLHSHHTVIEDEELWGHAEALVEQLGLSHFINVQFYNGKLLEVNPRKSTMIYDDDFDLVWLGLRYALGQIGEREIRAAGLRPGRQARYYFDCLCWG